MTITPEDPDIVVRAVDWVGLVSGNCTYEAEVDPFPPVIDTGKIPHWTRVLDPIIEFTVTDRGSGLDRDSIYYRLLRDGEDYGTWTADGLIYTGYAGDLSFLNMSLKLELERDFSGTIEIVANDLSGNVARTDPIHIAQDRSRPLIEILYPAKGSTIDKKVINLSFSLNDGDGSGIDTSSSVLKFSMNSKDWADLDNPGVWNGDGSLYTVEMLLRKGHYEIAFSAEDKVGNSATLNSNFTVDIPPENEIPVVHINNPVNNSRFFGGWPFILDASGTSDDGLGGLDPMKLTWYSNISGYLGSGMSLKVVFEDEGVHRITLYADDGEYNVSAWIVLNIVQRHEIDPGDEDVPDKDNFVTDLIIASVVIVLLVLVVVAAIAIRRKDKRTPYSEE